jgi:LMBR1 domain-containing protein 1
MALGGVETFLVISAVVVSVAILAIALVTLIKFQHPDDKNQAWFPKFMVILSLFLVFGTAMIMPYDVAARGNPGIDMNLLWQIVLIAVAAFALVLIPFAFFYYEGEVEDVNDEGRGRKCCDGQCCSAICYTFFFAVIIIVLCVILYATPANTAEVPTHRISQPVNNFVEICTSVLGTPGNGVAPFRNTASSGTECLAQGGGCSDLGQTFTWSISVTFIVYLFALLSFIGWWFFFLFAGVGLVGLPLDLINDFRTRPKPISSSKWLQECSALVERCDAQLTVANKLRDGPGGAKEYMNAPSGFGQRLRQRKLTRAMLSAEQDYYFLRRDFDLLKYSREFSKTNPLWYGLKLVLGVLGAFLSVAWLLHIILFILPGRNNEVDPFLNTLFIELEGVASGDFPLFGVLAYAIFVFYLMWATMIGAFKVGIRILIVRMYPMEVGKTYMNAFLANCWVLLLCTFPMVQFIATAFPIYARYTAVEAIFGNQVRYLRGIKVFWINNVFIIMMLAIAILAIPVFLICPNSKKKELKKKLEEKATERQKRI